MKSLFKVVTIVAVLALVIGATLIFSLNAGASEVVVFDGEINQSYTTNGNGFVVVDHAALTQAIRDDIAANGAPTQYEVIATAQYVSGASGYAVFGFYQDDP